MRKLVLLTAIVGAMGLATSAGATVTASNLSASTGTLTAGTLVPGDNLTNNSSAFSSNSAHPKIYLLDEGTNASSGEHTFLLHFDQKSLYGLVEGSFDFNLGAGDAFADVYSDSASLLGSDDLTNGVTYQRCNACVATILRGLEPSGFPIFGDSFSISPNQVSNPNAPLYTVNYRFQNDFLTMDEIRFGFTEGGAVPEPASWALMILGFGAAGAMLRRRATAFA
jgi:hypothetical protein